MTEYPVTTQQAYSRNCHAHFPIQFKTPLSSFSCSSRSNPDQQTKRVFVAGATGYIGKFVTRELVARKYDVVSFAREQSGIGSATSAAQTRWQLQGSEVRFGNVCDSDSLLGTGIRGERFDAVVSCLTSRTGGVKDSWMIDYQANCNVLEAARAAKAKQFILLSAICVQKPMLEFQKAKLKFERELMNSGITYSIVRPTAFFKSLSGQVEALKKGKPYVMFGNGELTSCKPISEADLARFIAECLDDPGKQNEILPVGGPGAPISAKEQGELLFQLMGRKPDFKKIPVRIFDLLIPLLNMLSKLFPMLEDKAELARIGRYYAMESMLILDPATGMYDGTSTPSFGKDTLEEFYTRILKEGCAGQELGAHSIFH